MKYDFDTLVGRGPGNLKAQWTPEAVKQAGYVSFEAAEMDFATAPSVIRSLSELVKNGLYGFQLMTPEYEERICWWMKTVRDWKIRPEWIVPAMGTIFSVATAIRMTLKPGERIIVPGPGYNRYAQAASRMGYGTVVSPMRECGGRFTFDFESLERCMADPLNRLLVLCNPHNPTGRVWTMEELTEIARLSAKYDVVVFSDEIFAEIVFDGRRTVPYCEIREGRSRAIVCTSLGKTFNFTGVNHANVIIPDAALRERFTKQRTADHYGSLEPFAYAAIMGAYTQEGLDWKEQMLQVVEKNRTMVSDYFSAADSPGRIHPVEGTYVCWIKWELSDLAGEKLKHFLDDKALVPMEIGTEFGREYNTYTRMNLASSAAQTAMAIERLRAAVKEYRG